ncbi:MAG: NAD(+)/NADH kinase [Anaerolineae bacterium]|jgi:NAD+ kinase|nr:NAD(+)/NADH kinase [Anaerolineae bacterium]
MPEKFSLYRHIAIITHPTSEEARELSREVERFFSEELHRDVCVYTIEDEEPPQCLMEEPVDLVISVGGDGTMLRASHVCGPRNIPLIGINLGRLGFLTELTPEDWKPTLESFFTGKLDPRIEERMMLHGIHSREGKVLNEWDVLNELVVVRGRFVRPITLSVSVNHTPIVGYVADGLIIASATGSTAYALAVGGPILLPEMRNMIVIPISPHFSIDRAFVLTDEDTVSIRLDTDHEAVISPDGKQSVMILNGDVLTITASKYAVKFVRFSNKRSFYRNLMQYLEKNPIALKMNEGPTQQD